MVFKVTLKQAVGASNGMLVGLDQVVKHEWNDNNDLHIETEAEDEYLAADGWIEISEHGFATLRVRNLGIDPDELTDIEVQFQVYRPLRQEDIGS